MAYTVLKNAGYVPPEVEERKEVNSILEMLPGCTDEGKRYRQMQKLKYLLTKINSKRTKSLCVTDEYYRQVLDKIT